MHDVMRRRMPLLLLALILLILNSSACSRAKSDAADARLASVISPREPAAASAAAKIDFAKQIRPILEAKCQPCHFAGGTMYERLPFDRPETIRNLGTKLFTRLKDENEQRLIREYLAEPLESVASARLNN